MRDSSLILLAIGTVVAITLIVYWIQISRATARAHGSAAPIYVAKPDWYVSNMERQPTMVLYDGGNYYYGGV